MTPNRQPRDVERALQQLWGESAPAADFVDRLETRLLDAYPAAPTRARNSGGRLRWALAAAIALVVVVFLLIIGPERAWAQIQRWLGYVPGIGFVEHLDQARTLAAPAALTRSGVTLRVAQFVALADRTEIVLVVDGVDSSRWTATQLQGPQPEVMLIADDERFDVRAASLTPGRLAYTFPPLPTDVSAATLHLSRLPLAPVDLAPGAWELALAFESLEPAAAGQLPTPYSPTGARDTRQGITVEVADVVQAAAETSVRLRLTWADSDWGSMVSSQGLWVPRLSGRILPEFVDDVGHSYGPPNRGTSGPMSVQIVTAPEHTPTPAPAVHVETRDLTYSPISAFADRLTLTVEALAFAVPVSHTVALAFEGPPQPGTSIAPNIALAVAGIPVRLERAGWFDVGEPFPSTRPELVLDFSVDNPADRAIFELSGSLMAPGSETLGSLPVGMSAYGLAGVRMVFGWPDEGPLPAGPIQITLDRAFVEVHGPWRLTWAPPQSAQSGLAPLRLSLENAVAEDQGLTLAAHSVTLTDRLTTIDLQLQDAPGGAALAGLAPLQSYHIDAAGQELPRPDLSVSPAGLEAPDRVLAYAGPATSLADELTLVVERLAVIHPDPQTLTIDVPADIRPYRGGGASGEHADSWPVDVNLELAGQRVRYSTANLIDSGYELRVQLSRFDAVSLNWFYGAPTPVWSRVDGPHGQVVPINTPESYSEGMFTVLDRAWLTPPSATLTFPVAVDPNTGGALAGSYSLTVEGLRVIVPGRWRIPIDLSEPRGP